MKRQPLSLSTASISSQRSQPPPTPRLAVARADGAIQLFDFVVGSDDEDDLPRLKSIQVISCRKRASFQDDDDGDEGQSDLLCLSIDWSSPLEGLLPELAVSLSSGEIVILSYYSGSQASLDDDDDDVAGRLGMGKKDMMMKVSARWNAHGYEAWIVAWEPETETETESESEEKEKDVLGNGREKERKRKRKKRVWSGGDDCILRVWDISEMMDRNGRGDDYNNDENEGEEGDSTMLSLLPVGICKKFQAGVTSIAFHPVNSHRDLVLVAVGSYDTDLRIFITSNPNSPIWDSSSNFDETHDRPSASSSSTPSPGPKVTIPFDSNSGGLWRLKWQPQQPLFNHHHHQQRLGKTRNVNNEDDGGDNSTVFPLLLAAACMHGGFRIFKVFITSATTFEPQNGNHHIKVVSCVNTHKILKGGHEDEKLAYGIDWSRRRRWKDDDEKKGENEDIGCEDFTVRELDNGLEEESEEEGLILATCSFYDAKVCVWRI